MQSSCLDLLLDQVMIRSNKRKLPNFPNMKEHNIVLDFNEVHGKSYCQLVEVIQRNLMLADWFDRNHKESLLNPKSSKYAAQTAENVSYLVVWQATFTCLLATLSL